MGQARSRSALMLSPALVLVLPLALLPLAACSWAPLEESYLPYHPDEATGEDDGRLLPDAGHKGADQGGEGPADQGVVEDDAAGPPVDAGGGGPDGQADADDGGGGPDGQAGADGGGGPDGQAGADGGGGGEPDGQAEEDGGGEPDGQVGEDAGAQPGTATIGPAGGELTSADGRVVLVVSPGALPSEVRLAVTPATEHEPLAVDRTYELAPHGQLFLVSVLVRYRWDPRRIDGVLLARGLWLVSESAGRYELLADGELSPEEQQASGRLAHFSRIFLASDSDGDGHPDPLDGCPNVPDPEQTRCPPPSGHGRACDADCDGLVDLLDEDDDGDGWPDALDNCPRVANQEQQDKNQDGVGDACDLDGDGLPDEADWDLDGDGHPNVQDVCPWVSDAGQADLDGDGLGDACDPDRDGDGVAQAAGDCNDRLAEVHPGAAEVCNGRDDDCDPATPDGKDDGELDAACPTGRSSSCADGNLVCLDGELTCLVVAESSPDLCDGVDNDCDPGTPDGADEAEFDAACPTGSRGLCLDGRLACRDGALACLAVAELAPDLCDGVDNDCDPETPDGAAEPELDRDCDSGLAGICAAGKIRCTDGQLHCAALLRPEQGDPCDGLDNDCDPDTADGASDPQRDAACDTGEHGRCAPGRLTCLDGELRCRSMAEPVGEICNGEDDDCDGATDEEPAASASCDDGRWCNGPERCEEDSRCAAGSAPDCDDRVGCTEDGCDEEEDRCRHERHDERCDDGLWCNGAEACDPELDCLAGVPPDCADAHGCTQDGCDEEHDRCSHEPLDERCDDRRWCNGAERCDPEAGCVEGPVPDCADELDCTADRCDPEQDRCLHLPQHELCDDGRWCTGEERCDAQLGCQQGPEPDCDDAEPCTDDRCDEEHDRCSNQPLDDGASCVDGDRCNGEESCQAGRCQAGIPLDCDDGDRCTTDSCDPQEGCRRLPLGNAVPDADGDGFFPCVPPIDCADEDPVVWPGAPEIPGDGRDGDCDGSDLPLSDDHGVFVAVDGDDANPGTRQHPLRTIQLAVLQAEEQHKSVFVSAGTYRQSVSLPGGMGLYGGYAAGSWAYDWDANATIIEGVGEVAIGVRNRAGERTVVAGVVVRRQGTYGLKLQGAGRTVVLRSVFFSLPGAAPGVAIQALGESYLANLTVEDASSGIFLDVLGKEQTLLSSSIHAGQELALELRCEGAAEPTTAVIRSNVITGEGVGIVYYGYAYAYPVGYQYCRSTVLVEDNIVHAGAAMAIECDYHGRGLVLRRNDIRPVGNEGWSTAIRICTNAAMENNRIACSDQGSDVSAVYGGGRLTGNLVTCPGVHDRSIALHNMLEGALIANTIDGGAGRTAIGIEGICPVAVNNIITTSGGQERLCVIEKQMSAQHPATPTRLRNNDFFACPTALYRDRETGDIGDIRILNRMIDVAEVGGNISEDPRFVDRERGDYHLGEGSPCIDSGLELEQASTDIDGELRPRGAGFDIGADER